MRHKVLLFALSIIASITWCDAQNYLTFKAGENNASFCYVNKGGNHPDVQYSSDNGTSWKALMENDTIVLKKKGDKILLRGNNPEGFSHAWDQFSQFCMNGAIEASGSIMTLIDEYGKSSTIPSEDCFSQLFAKCESLTQAPSLPAIHLKARCYNNMFWYCKKLKQMPVLPATTLAEECYKGMFAYCSELTQTTALPATTLADFCYENMFNYCMGLIQAPALPAKEMKTGCYRNMFFFCTSLIQAPQLPASKTAEHCYSGMFGHCESLKSAPYLPAKKAEAFCYNEMFSYCTSMTQAPAINASKLEKGSFRKMFFGCSSINQIRVKFTKWSDATDLWVDRTNAKGNFICPASLATKYGANNIPKVWKVTKKK